MIPELVKGAVQVKMTCTAESPLISEAEYFYACIRALRELGAFSDRQEELRQAVTIEELREKFTPYFREKREGCKEKPPICRLLNLLIHCRVEGEITDEIRKILDEK